jgi:hypothetical protein
MEAVESASAYSIVHYSTVRYSLRTVRYERQMYGVSLQRNRTNERTNEL